MIDQHRGYAPLFAQYISVQWGDNLYIILLFVGGGVGKKLIAMVDEGYTSIQCGDNFYIILVFAKILIPMVDEGCHWCQMQPLCAGHQ